MSKSYKSNTIIKSQNLEIMYQVTKISLKVNILKPKIEMTS